jgi:hypothetical protein
MKVEFGFSEQIINRIILEIISNNVLFVTPKTYFYDNINYVLNLVFSKTISIIQR